MKYSFALAVALACVAPFCARAYQPPPLTPGSSTTVLHGNASGGPPSYGPVDLNSNVSNTLSQAHGGTGSTTPFGTTSTTFARGDYVPIAALAFGVKADGQTDDTTAIQNALDACFNAGGGTVTLPAGQIVVSGLHLRPFCHLRGAGVTATKLLCTATKCVTQDTTESLPGVGFTDVTLAPFDAGNDGDIALYLTSFQQSEIGNLLISGFTTSTAPISFGGVVPSTIRNTALGTNVVFNNVHDINIENAAGCMVLQGHYATGSPPPNPDQVLTINTFRNLTFFNVSGKCIDMIRAVDTNVFVGGVITFGANGSKGVVQGDDPNFPSNTVNVFVNSNIFVGLAFSATASQTVTFFTGSNGEATDGYGISTDQLTAPSTIPGITATATVVDPGMPCQYRIQGKNMTGIHTGYLQGLNVDTLKCGVSWQTSSVLDSPTAGFDWVTPQGTQVGILSGTGVLTNGTVELPCGAGDGQRVIFTSTAITVQLLTVQGCAGNGESVFGAPSYLSPSAPFALTYVRDSKTWVRDSGTGNWGGEAIISGLSDGFTLVTPVGYRLYTLSQTGAFVTGGTIQLPCGATDGTVVTFDTTALTVPNLAIQGCAGDGESVFGAPTYLAPTRPFTMYYVGNSKTWLALAAQADWAGTGTTTVNASGFTLVSPTGYADTLISANGTFASGIIQLPCGAPDGTEETYNTTQLTVTALTVQGCGGTGSVFGAPSALSPTTPFAMRYIASSGSWVRTR